MVGFATHGYARGVFDLFENMLRSHVSPNEVTSIAILSACAHVGLVEEGRRLFLSMKERFNLEPNVDHYACMVDLFGRKGLLEEAKALIERMTMKPTNALYSESQNWDKVARVRKQMKDQQMVKSPGCVAGSK